jgi:hypothetical protein
MQTALRPCPKTSFIYDILIEPEFRGKGHGKSSCFSPSEAAKLGYFTTSLGMSKPASPN